MSNDGGDVIIESPLNPNVPPFFPGNTHQKEPDTTESTREEKSLDEQDEDQEECPVQSENSDRRLTSENGQYESETLSSVLHDQKDENEDCEENINTDLHIQSKQDEMKESDAHYNEELDAVGSQEASAVVADNDFDDFAPFDIAPVHLVNEGTESSESNKEFSNDAEDESVSNTGSLKASILKSENEQIDGIECWKSFSNTDCKEKQEDVERDVANFESSSLGQEDKPIGSSKKESQSDGTEDGLNVVVEELLTHTKNNHSIQSELEPLNFESGQSETTSSAEDFDDFASFEQNSGTSSKATEDADRKNPEEYSYLKNEGVSDVLSKDIKENPSFGEEPSRTLDEQEACIDEWADFDSGIQNHCEKIDENELFKEKPTSIEPETEDRSTISDTKNQSAIEESSPTLFVEGDLNNETLEETVDKITTESDKTTSLADANEPESNENPEFSKCKENLSTSNVNNVLTKQKDFAAFSETDKGLEENNEALNVENQGQTDNWAFFASGSTASANNEEDGFADFTNFEAFSQPFSELKHTWETNQQNTDLNIKAVNETKSGLEEGDEDAAASNGIEEEDDFDDFADFSTPASMSSNTTMAATEPNNSGTFQQYNGISDIDEKQSISPSFNLSEETGLQSIEDMLNEVDTKCEDLAEHDPVVTEDPLLLQDLIVSMPIASDVSKELNDVIEGIWSIVCDLCNSPSLLLLDPSSPSHSQCSLNEQLLYSLGVDLNNTLSSVKQNLPKYAAQLGLLQPMKSGDSKGDESGGVSAYQLRGNNNNANSAHRNQQAMSCTSPTPDAVPDVEFDWGTSGLKNPLEMQSLSLDFFDSQFNSCSAASASATSQLEQELLNELGDEVGGRGTGISRGGEDSQSLGGTSVSASAVSRDRDSKLASILAVAQSSSHENVMAKKVSELMALDKWFFIGVWDSGVLSVYSV
ncbi:aftiphilin-like isoform X2 [Symsagittifera roscoffensis]|uniref:aftiphilin-like isoform X2 n=1 Tax=Symsagittifera roscoffensis TaxID=84072 RepID=UPI00307C2341